MTEEKLVFNIVELRGVEDWREYVLPDDSVYRIERPWRLYTKKGSTSHRVVDMEDIAHYIPAGWKVIRWKGEVVA